MDSPSKILATPGEILQGAVECLHAPKLLRFVHPIYSVNDKSEPSALGSCVLLRRKRQLYLATAAHVLEHNKPEGEFAASSLYVGGRDGELFLVAAQFQMNEEPADIGMSELTGDLAEAWDLYPALDVDSQLAQVETTGLHLVVGYPIRRKSFNLDRARNRITHDPFLYAERRTAHKGDGAYHFSMAMQKSHVKSGDKNQTAPSPRGASGGGVFSLNSPTPLLAGIFIEYNGARMKATKASCLLALLK